MGTAGISIATDDDDDDDDDDEQDNVDFQQPSLSDRQRFFPGLYSARASVDKRYTRGRNYWDLTKAEILARRGWAAVRTAEQSRLRAEFDEDRLLANRGYTAFKEAEQARLVAESGEVTLRTTDSDGDAGMLDVDDARLELDTAALDLDERLAGGNEAVPGHTTASTINPRPAASREDEYEKLRDRVVRFLLTQDHGSEEGFWQVMDEETQSTVASILVDDLSLSLGFKHNHRKAYERCHPNHDKPAHLWQMRLGQFVGITGTQTALDSLYYLLHDGRTLLFSDWDPDRHYYSGDTATPTLAYDAYIRQQYRSLLTAGDDIFFNDMYAELTQVMDLDAMQLQAILILLYNNGNNPDVPVHYQLGVVRSGYWRRVAGQE
nr:hypothetical protein B0A51_13096 [Rachicladosporium sp. CCFEE 5018]